MDFSSATKPAPIGGVNVTPRADVVASQGSVAVELPPEKTVQSSQAGDAVLVEIRARTREENGQAAAERRIGTDRQQDQARADQIKNDTLERRLIIEPRSRSIVLQKKDPDTGETVSQLPDETLLKLRIYSRELTERARQASEASHSIERRA
jgi:hypothetical protein